DRDLLYVAIFFQSEVFLFKTAHRSPMIVRHGDKDIHEPDVDADGGVILGIGSQAGCKEERTDGGWFHQRLSGLDAGRAAEIPSARGISAGKGSPSTQTAPSSKYSFFQIGTVRFRVSINQRQASNAGPRWPEATTIKTLVSPISSFPRRWIMVTSR